MIQIKINTDDFSKVQQLDKITEEYKEVVEAFEKCVLDKLDTTFLQHRLVGECFDLIQATNQLIRMLEDEKGYIDLYKIHLRKLQERAERGEIKIEEYLEV